MKPLEPGDRFTITYGNDKTLEVVSPSFRDERKLAALEDKARQSAEGGVRLAEPMYQAIEESFRTCVKHMDSADVDELLETMNLSLMQEVIRKTNSPSEDDEKKSE